MSFIKRFGTYTAIVTGLVVFIGLYVLAMATPGRLADKKKHSDPAEVLAKFEHNAQTLAKQGEDIAGIDEDIQDMQVSSKKAEARARHLEDEVALMASDAKSCNVWRSIWIFVANVEGATKLDGSIIPFGSECYLSVDGTLYVLFEKDGVFMTQFFQTQDRTSADVQACPSGTKTWFFVEEFNGNCLDPPDP